MFRIPWVLLTASVCWYGCGEKLYNDNTGASAGDIPDAGDGPVTYDSQIKPIADARCTGCHSTALSGSDRNGAPPDINLDTYAAAKASADECNSEIQGGFMPPGAPLPDAEKALFQRWLDDGLLESNGNGAPSTAIAPLAKCDLGPTTEPVQP